MRYISLAGTIAVIVSGIVLISYSPDVLSTAVIAVMILIMMVGAVIGIVPAILYTSGFKNGVESIYHAAMSQSDSSWNSILQIRDVFHQKTLNKLFDDYKEKVQFQKDHDQLMSDIEEFINEESLSVRSWQIIIAQIPEILTGLGIMGTFIGLIIGVRGLGFTSVSMALSSVQTLLAGIETAFYTSIVGVILSILYNLLYRTIWNILLRQMSMFMEEFHLRIIPTVEEQRRYTEKKEIKKIISLLERIPKNTGYSVSGIRGQNQDAPQAQRNEQILLPQILEGLKKKEFSLYLQPRFDLVNRECIAAEALVRWNHSRLGLVSPAVFIPILEQNGLITKLDQYLWEEVCKKMKEWLDADKRPHPISINVTKTDILAIDIPGFLKEMIDKYNIPPRNIQVEIAKNAYTESAKAAADTEARLRELGFAVLIDGFDGDFISLGSDMPIMADQLKLDLRNFQDASKEAVTRILSQAREMRISVVAEGIENMEQMSLLRKNGCTQGQGFYLSMPIPVNVYEANFLD